MVVVMMMMMMMTMMIDIEDHDNLIKYNEVIVSATKYLRAVIISNVVDLVLIIMTRVN